MATILVIDDERPIRSALREILEFEKFKVDDAEDAHDAVENGRVLEGKVTRDTGEHLLGRKEDLLVRPAAATRRDACVRRYV